MNEIDPIVIIIIGSLNQTISKSLPLSGEGIIVEQQVVAIRLFPLSQIMFPQV